jgi:hypothetical protein
VEVAAMAIHYASEVTVDRPPDDVFPYLIEHDKQALWSDVPMRRIDGETGPMRTGTRFEVTFGMGPIKATVGIELTAVEPGSLMSWKSFSGPISWQGEYRLEPSGSGTHLSQQGALEFHGAWRLLQPIAGGEIKSAEVKELEKLKAAAEAAA